MQSKGVVPDSVFEWYYRWKLAPAQDPDADVASGVIEDDLPVAEQGQIPIKVRGDLDVARTVAWQMKNHLGYIQSYVSSLRNGPISRQHESWIRMSRAMHSDDDMTTKGSVDALMTTKLELLIVCAKNDPIIVADELRQDVEELLKGVKSFTFKLVDAEHDFPITKSETVVEMVLEFWTGSH
ncbi:MAG: hypothetical protein Q9220_001503 [cf. Caloplaca sp. 1 TL-2023]